MKQLITIMSTLICGFSSHAANLMDIRTNTQIYSGKSQQDAKDETANLILGIRKKLGTDKNTLPENIKALINNKDLSNSGNRLSFSSVLKRFVNKSAQRLSIAERYQTPVYIESTVSSSILKDAKRKYQNSICLQSINTDADELTTALVTLAEENRKQKNVLQSVGTNAKSLVAANSILSYIESAPQYNGKNIRRLIGDLTSIEIVDGVIREIHFARNNVKLQFSLNMLSTLRSKSDLYYIRSLECYVDYFTEQEHLFTKRLRQMTAHINLSGLSKQIDEIKSKAARNLNISKEIQAKLNSETENKDIAYLNKLNSFYEGKTFSDNAKEKEFLEKRVNRIRSFKSYLTEQYKNSVNVHIRLEKLTTEQQNYLVDLFLQLNGENVLSSADSNAILNALKAKPAVLDQDSQIGVDYARLVTEQINTLSSYLDYEKNQAELRGKDSQVLQNLAN